MTEPISLYEVKAGKVISFKSTELQKIVVLKEPIDISKSSNIINELMAAFRTIHKHMARAVSGSEYTCPVHIPKAPKVVAAIPKHSKYEELKKEIKEVFRINPSEEYTINKLYDVLKNQFPDVKKFQIYAITDDLIANNYIHKKPDVNGKVLIKTALVTPELSPHEKTDQANKERNMRAELLGK